MKTAMAIKKVVGRWRMFWGFCPQCNSDAPELDTCTVCGCGLIQDGYPPSKFTKRMWWKNFCFALASREKERTK